MPDRGDLGAAGPRKRTGNTAGTSGLGHVELIHTHSNQIDRDRRLLDSCWCRGMALGEIGLNMYKNNLDSIPNAKMKSDYRLYAGLNLNLNFDNVKSYDPDAVGIEVDYLIPDMPMGHMSDSCSG